MAAAAENLYLGGAYAPVPDEITVFDLPVDGALPEELVGRYVRIGPNPLHPPPEPAKHHWFVGDGMVHGVRLAHGRAEWYRNRWVRSDSLAAALGERPPPGPLHTFDTVNTNVAKHAGVVYALVEAGANPVELGDELETLRRSDFAGTNPGGFAAHPHHDPATGEWHSVGYHWAWGFLRYLVVDANGRVRTCEEIPVPDGPMVHDFALTATRVVLLDLPVTFDLSLASAGFAFPYGWNPDHPARVGVLPRDGRADDVVWCETDPYVFHVLNAYDDADGGIVLDVVRHARIFAHDHTGPTDGDGVLERWLVDPAAGTVRTRRLAEPHGVEFPRTHPGVLGARHRYGYCTVLEPTRAAGAGAAGPVYKVDVDTGDVTSHDLGPGRASMEAVFVPREGSTAEDDGWLMSIVLDEGVGRADLVLLDARDLGAPPVATVHLPRRVPLGFHGNWIPDAAPWAG